MTDAPELLTPMVTKETQPFWDGTAEGELRMQACGSCGRLRFPPRTMCPWCQSNEREWRPVAPTGTIWSYCVPHPPLLPAYAELAPYNVVVVALDEDPVIRLVGNLVATPEGPINEIDPDTIEIGARVTAAFAPGAGGLVMPRWVLAPE